jgi:hypothetical protein
LWDIRSALQEAYSGQSPMMMDEDEDSSEEFRAGLKVLLDCAVFKYCSDKKGREKLFPDSPTRPIPTASSSCSSQLQFPDDTIDTSPYPGRVESQSDSSGSPNIWTPFRSHSESAGPK